MPANLPPDYHKVEERYRAAKTPEEKIACIEEMMAIIPKHKGTDHLRGDWRRKLAKLREGAGQKGSSRRASAFYVVREGAGQVVLVGAPNVGKSALLATLTNATPEVSEAPCTTWVPVPGMAKVENVQVQLIDTPSLRREYVEPELVSLIRRADAMVLVIDLQAFPIEQLEETLAILEEHRVVPLRDDGKEPDAGTKAVPTLVAVNKCDDEGLDGDYEVLCELLEEKWPMLPVSAEAGRNLDRLGRMVFDLLDLIRVYSRPPGREPDMSAPFVMKRGGTVEDFAGKVHKDFLDQLKSARVWGSAAFDGQMVGRDHVLEDGDVVELRV